MRVAPEFSSTDGNVRVYVALRNEGPAPVAVNGRMLAVPRGFADTVGELVAEVEGPPGYQNTRRTAMRAGGPSPEDFVELAPHGEVARTVDLTSFESLHVPGRYRVRMIYRNHAPGAAGGKPAFTGTLTSDWQAFVRRKT